MIGSIEIVSWSIALKLSTSLHALVKCLTVQFVFFHRIYFLSDLFELYIFFINNSIFVVKALLD